MPKQDDQDEDIGANKDINDHPCDNPADVLLAPLCTVDLVQLTFLIDQGTKLFVL